MQGALHPKPRLIDGVVAGEFGGRIFGIISINENATRMSPFNVSEKLLMKM